MWRLSFLFGKGKEKLLRRSDLWFGLMAFALQDVWFGLVLVLGPGFCFLYKARNAMGKYSSEEANKGNRGNRQCKCLVYLRESMCINRNIDIAYTLSPSGRSAKGKLGKECEGSFRPYLPTSLVQVYRYTGAHRQKHQTLHLPTHSSSGQFPASMCREEERRQNREKKKSWAGNQKA